MQSQDNRDESGLAGGEDLAAEEARPPDERFGRLEQKHDELKRDVEKKHDELKKDVSDVRSDVKVLTGHVSDMRSDVSGAVGKIEGQEKVLTEMLSIVKETADLAADREHVTFTAKVDVDRAKDLAKVEVDKEEKLDTIDAKKKKREVLVKGLGLVAGGGGLIELLHRLGVL